MKVFAKRQSNTGGGIFLQPGISEVVSIKHIEVSLLVMKSTTYLVKMSYIMYFSFLQFGKCRHQHFLSLTTVNLAPQ